MKVIDVVVDLIGVAFIISGTIFVMKLEMPYKFLIGGGCFIAGAILLMRKKY